MRYLKEPVLRVCEECVQNCRCRDGRQLRESAKQIGSSDGVRLDQYRRHDFKPLLGVHPQSLHGSMRLTGVSHTGAILARIGRTLL